MKKKVFDIKKYNLDQLIDALTCPLNIWGTCEEHKCDQFYLHQHPNLLMEHYASHGGIEYWRQKREQYIREVEEFEEDYQI